MHWESTPIAFRKVRPLHLGKYAHCIGKVRPLHFGKYAHCIGKVRPLHWESTTIAFGKVTTGRPAPSPSHPGPTSATASPERPPRSRHPLGSSSLTPRWLPPRRSTQRELSVVVVPFFTSGTGGVDSAGIQEGVYASDRAANQKAHLHFRVRSAPQARTRFLQLRRSERIIKDSPPYDAERFHQDELGPPPPQAVAVSAGVPEYVASVNATGGAPAKGLIPRSIVSSRAPTWPWRVRTRPLHIQNFTVRSRRGLRHRNSALLAHHSSSASSQLTPLGPPTRLLLRLIPPYRNTPPSNQFDSPLLPQEDVEFFFRGLDGSRQSMTVASHEGGRQSMSAQQYIASGEPEGISYANLTNSSISAGQYGTFSPSPVRRIPYSDAGAHQLSSYASPMFSSTQRSSAHTPTSSGYNNGHGQSPIPSMLGLAQRGRIHEPESGRPRVDQVRVRWAGQCGRKRISGPQGQNLCSPFSCPGRTDTGVVF
ncbi:hypothetical protein Btru_024069 [Bulinus truncatus]|nr:hypothetical protein Btru_024069 [Bulinus truncatus]